MLDRGRVGPGFRARLPLKLQEGILSVTGVVLSVGTTAPIYNSGTATAPVIAVSPADTGLGTNGTVTGAERQLIQDLANITGAPSVDANGWQVNYEASAKRIWRKRFLGVATAAAPTQSVVSAAALPVGIADLSGVHIVSCALRLSANAGLVTANVQGAEATTTLTVAAATTDGTNLSALAGTIDVFVTLAER